MKNVLIYTNPAGSFNEENKTLVKIHIDNSLELGWKREDILLFTNFEYQHNDVKAIHVPEYLDCPWDRTSNKIFVIKYLLERGMLEGLCWYHDFDAYQNEAFTEEELGVGEEIGLTGYGYKDQINGGSFFFRETMAPIFEEWCRRTLVTVRTRADEKSMTDMVREGLPHKLLNIAYNFGQRCPELCYEQAEKPLKVLHFHPHYRYWQAHAWNLPIFMYGKNRHGIPMMSSRLIEVFRRHGIE